MGVKDDGLAGFEPRLLAFGSYSNPLGQGFPNFSTRDPQNNGARDWQSPLSPDVTEKIKCAHRPYALGLSKHGLNDNTKEQGPVPR